MRGGNRQQPEKVEEETVEVSGARMVEHGATVEVEEGETVRMDGPSYLVKDSDGVIVTARSQITFTRAGTYTLIAPDGTETTVTVSKPDSDK